MSGSGPATAPVGAGDGTAGRAAAAERDRRLAGRIAELRLVVPLREDAADRLRQVEVVGEPGAEAVPDLLVPDDIVGVAQLRAVALRDIVAGPQLEAAGARARAAPRPTGSRPNAAPASRLTLQPSNVPLSKSRCTGLKDARRSSRLEEGTVPRPKCARPSAGGSRGARETMNRIATIVKGYPRLSETFIAQEILGLEQRGDRAAHRLAAASDRDEGARPQPRDRGRGALPARIPEGRPGARPRRARHGRSAAGLRARAEGVSRGPRGATRRSTAAAASARPACSPRELPARRRLAPHALSCTRPRRSRATRRSSAGSAGRSPRMPRTSGRPPQWELRDKLADAAWGVTCTRANLDYLRSLAAQPQQGRSRLSRARFLALSRRRRAEGARRRDASPSSRSAAPWRRRAMPTS